MNRESNIIQREICERKKPVTRTRPDKKPALTLKSLAPKRNVTRTVISPARADGKPVGKLVVPKKEGRPIDQPEEEGWLFAVNSPVQMGYDPVTGLFHLPGHDSVSRFIRLPEVSRP